MFNKLKILKKMKIKNLIAVAALLLGSTSAFAAFDVKQDNILYATTTGGGDGKTEATATYLNVVGVASAVEQLTVPATFYKSNAKDEKTYYAVRGFAANWDKNTTDGKDVTATLKDLTINIDKIATYSNVFTNLSALEKLTVKISSDDAVSIPTLPDNVKKTIKEIDYSALPGLAVLPDQAFKVSGDNFKLLAKVSLPNAMTEIKWSAFEYSNITEITIPEKLTKIGNFAFNGAKTLATADFSKNTELAEIGTGAFRGCEALTSIDLSKAEKLATIGKNAFEKSGLTAIDLSKTKVKQIMNGAFKNSQLATITFAEGTTGIEAEAFEKAALTTIALPATLGYVGNFAFNGCEALATVDMSATEKLGWIGANAFAGTAITAFEVPATVTEIKASAFDGCTSLATFTIAEPAEIKLATLGTGLFKGCEALTSVDLTNSKPTTIDAGAFVGCTSLAEITLPATVTTLPDNLFADCVIEELDASNVTSFGRLFTYYDAASGLHKDRDEAHANTTLKSVKIGASNIGGYLALAAKTFSYCTALESVELKPVKDVNIAPKVFWYCSGLKTFTYEPENNTDFGKITNDAFLGCTPFVKINTTNYYTDANPEPPTNATYGDVTGSTIKTVEDKSTPNQFVAKYVNFVNEVSISSEDAKVYTIYVDGETAYYQACRTFNGMYVIPKETPVIIKTEEEKEVPVKITSTTKSSVGFTDVFTFSTNMALAEFQGTYCGSTRGKYVYRLTNGASGFGFTFFTGTTMKAGQFFIITKGKPADAARLNNVWLDEDGNVEGDATAINKVKVAAEKDAIYNLAGQKVAASYKGIVIKNGKKYIQK